MPWRLEGTYFENCNCDVICPCVSGLGLLADNERCVYVFAFSVRAGEIEGVDVSGLSAVLVGDSPPDMSDMRYGLIVDAAATAAQRERLAEVFADRLGSSPIAVEVAPIEYAEEGRRHRLRVGDAIEVEVEDAPAAVGETDEPRRLSGLGHFVSSTLTVARATRSHVSAFGFDFSNEGKNGHSAPFSWSG